MSSEYRINTGSDAAATLKRVFELEDDLKGFVGRGMAVLYNDGNVVKAVVKTIIVGVCSPYLDDGVQVFAVLHDARFKNDMYRGYMGKFPLKTLYLSRKQALIAYKRKKEAAE